MQNKPSLTFGVLANWQLYNGTTAHRYLLSLLNGIVFGAQERGCRLLLSCGVGGSVNTYTPAWPVPTLNSIFAPVGPWNCDGLIVVPPFTDEARTRYVAELRMSEYPVVFAGAGASGPTVAVDNAAGIAQAFQHLHAHSHRRIGFISGHATPHGDSAIRRATYLAALAAHDLPLDPSLVVAGNHSFEGGKQAIRELLACPAPPTAVIASNDDSAFGALSAIHAAGLRVPEDIALIGFDDILDARIQVPPLTTIHNPTFELGYRSLTALADLLSGAWDGVAPIQVPTRLVIRRSCGCQPGHPGHASMHHHDFSACVAQMAEAALTEAQRAQPGMITALCHQLAHAFQAALATGDQPIFLAALADVLQQTEALTEEIAIWQSALSVLRAAHMVHTATPAHAILAADMIDQARIIVGERVRRQTTRALVQHMDVADRVGAMTAQLLAVVDEVHIAATLAANMVNLGIAHVVVARYTADGDDSPHWSTIALQCGLASTAARRFPTRSFPPSGVYPDEQAWQLAVLPLIVDNDVIGFVAFDATNLEACAAIMRNLASAMRTITLYAEAREGRRLAEEASRLKSRFLSMVSHELRTPLNLISGLSDMLLHEDLGARAQPTVLRADLEQISASAQHLGRLIGDVLDLASSDAGQLRLVRKPIDLSATLAMVAVTGQRMAQEKGLDWIYDVTQPGPRVLGDQTRLRQVVLNLISNAVKFTSHGTITLFVGSAQNNAIIRVSDTGLGIPHDEQPHVFDEFRRTEQSIALGYRGLGLGLAICKHLVEAHGGTITLQSVGTPGAGSRFDVQLPLLVDAHPLVCAPDSDIRAAAVHTPRVLIADDDPQIRGLHRRIVLARSAASQVIEAENGTVALASMAIERPDLVLLDLIMPELDGFGVLAAMRENPALHDIPVIVLTAQVLTDADIGRLGHSVAAILVKGVFNADEISAHIDAALVHRRKLGSVTQRLVHKALGFIHTHYVDTLSRELIALHVGVNENYLTDCFHREMGITPINYLARYRIGHAQILLAQSQQSITEIALAVGFGDSAYFSRVFQREVGVSPSSYRRNHHATRLLLA